MCKTDTPQTLKREVKNETPFRKYIFKTGFKPEQMAICWSLSQHEITSTMSLSQR